MSLLIQTCTGLNLPLVNIIQHYVGPDCAIEKVKKSVKAYFLTWEIPFIHEAKPRFYQVQINSHFRKHLWEEDTHASLEALKVGASHFLIKEEILKLAEHKKYLALNIFTAQISFKREKSIVDSETRKGYFHPEIRFKYKHCYLDKTANSFAEAFQESSEEIKGVLLAFYRKYKKEKDSSLPKSTIITYTKWSRDGGTEHCV